MKIVLDEPALPAIARDVVPWYWGVAMAAASGLVGWGDKKAVATLVSLVLRIPESDPDLQKGLQALRRAANPKSRDAFLGALSSGDQHIIRPVILATFPDAQILTFPLADGDESANLLARLAPDLANLDRLSSRHRSLVLLRRSPVRPLPPPGLGSARLDPSQGQLVREVAAHEMPATHSPIARRLSLADVACIAAAGMKIAARWWIDRAGHFALQ